MPSLPTSIESSYRTLIVKEIEAGRLADCRGECDVREGIVSVEKDQKPREKANTLVHEYFHNAIYEAGIELDDEDEERVVRVLANAVSALFNNTHNAGARAYLIEALRDG